MDFCQSARALFRTTLLGLVGLSASLAWPQETIIRVDPSAPLGAVNRAVLGNNTLAYLHFDPRISARGAGVWDPTANTPVDSMVTLARKVGTSVLRWPGGCAVHEYNWKLAVGPRGKRTMQPFGLPEFLRLANEVGAVPIITVADYWGDASDAADLVEYLNAPVGSNPNGGIDWAAVRATDGHRDPYGVVWFEYGNETAHGTHPAGTQPNGNGRRFDASEYARRYREYRAAMKGVDPKIRLGAVLNNDTEPALTPWTQAVIRKTADIADFYIEHAYLPQYSAADRDTPVAKLFPIAFAGPVQFAAVFDELDRFILETAGRSVPLAITEYNAAFIQDQPVPYRLSLGEAIDVAAMVQVLLQPNLHIASAEYWHFANEYWGMVKGYAPPYTLRPAYYALQLYNDHLGDTLLKTNVEGMTYEEPGGFAVAAARGAGTRLRLFGEPQPLDGKWKVSAPPGAAAEEGSSGELKVRISTRRALDYFHSYVTLPARASTGYRVTAQIRTEGFAHRGVQLQVGDARGWDATKSAALSDMVNGAEWQEASVDYVTRPDADAIDIRARRMNGAPEEGAFEVRNLRVQRFQPFTLPKIPYVSALATRRDGRIAVFLVNRSIETSTKAQLQIPGAQSAKGWTLSGPSVDATNETKVDNVGIRPLSVTVAGGPIDVELPPHSFSVIEAAVRATTAAKPATPRN